MHLTNAVSVVVPRPLPLGVADRGVAAAHRGEPVVPAPLIGVDRDHRPTRTPHDPPRRRAVGVRDDGQADLPALPSHHPADRWAVVLPAPVAGGLVGPPPRRVLGVAVRHTFFPPRSGTPRRPPGPGHPAASGPDSGRPTLAGGAGG